jgi:hypothetical protein
MFDIGKILKRAWQVLWNYRVLWIFGLLLALAGATGGGASGGGGSSSWRGNMGSGNEGNRFNPQNFDFHRDLSGMPAWMQDMATWGQQKVLPLFATPEKAVQTVIWMCVILLAFCIVIGLLLALVRYPAETAVMRMVDEHEQTGTKVKFKEGWKLGWNKRAFRLWVVDLLVGLPGLAFAAILIGLAINLAILGQRSDPLMFANMTGTIIFLGVFGLIFALFMIPVGLLRQLIARHVAIDGTTVGEAFSKGWTMFKSNFGHLMLTWVVMLGIGIGFGIALSIAIFILIPAYALMAIPGALVAGITGGLAYGITSIFAASTWAPWLIGGLVAIPFLFTVMFLPIYLIDGMYSVFSSNVYTLAFRQFKLIASVPPMPVMPPVVPPMVEQK